MAIEEVTEWATVARENFSPHPTGPRGRESPRISLSVQELMGAIARWRVEIDADIAGAGSPPGGADTQIQYNNGGAFDGMASTAVNEGATSTDLITHTIPATLTGGDYMYMYANQSAFAGAILNLYQDHPSSTAHALRLRCDGAGDAIQIDLGDVNMQSSGKLKFGDASTYIQGALTDTIDFYTGNNRRLAITTNLVKVENAAFAVAATEKLHLDGGGNTYLVESSADNVVLFVGGLAALTVDSSQHATFSEKVIFDASTTADPSYNIPEGVAPTSPVDGDHWLTAAGEYFVELNGVSVDLAAGGSGVPTGAAFPWPTSTVPTGYFEEDGALISMTTYEALYDVIGNDYGVNAGTTFTAAATDLITATSHGLVDDDVIEVTTSASDLPAGLTIDTKYFVISALTNTFEVSLTLGGAAVDITDAGTGTHTFHNQIALRDMRGEHLRGWAHGSANDPDRATRTDRGDGTTGDFVGTKQPDDFDSHSHGIGNNIGTRSSGGGSTVSAPVNNNIQSTSKGGSETRGRNIAVMWVIKY